MKIPQFIQTLCFVLFLLAEPFSAFSQANMNVVEKLVGFGMRQTENRNISAVIIHSTFNNSGGEKYDIDLVIKQFSRYGVSSHYVIGRDGTIYLLVKEQHVAFHAGKSVLPNGQTNVNSVSIGIELMTSFDESPTEEQVAALVILTNDIRKRHQIK